MSPPWLLVLAGGSGTRFWPRSRAKRPKQFLPLAGDEALIVTTIRRFLSWIPEERIVVVTTADLAADTRSILKSFPQVTVLAEPMAKNTAPALVMGMEWLKQKDASATAIVVPADHWISDVPEYLQVVKTAVAAANSLQGLCTIGIQPARAETGYGYIRSGAPAGEGAFQVDRFVEKPSREVAETMVQSPEYLWNSGMFVWTTDTFFREFRLHGPELVQAFEPYGAALKEGKNPTEALAAAYAKAPAISIDYALLEKSKKVSVVPGNFGWNDLGSFLSLGDVFPKVEGGVGQAKKVLAIDSLANIVDVPGKTVALLGVTDMILVDAGDVLLLATKERAQDVKRFVERLRAENNSDLV